MKAGKTDNKKNLMLVIQALYMGGAERVAVILASRLTEFFDVSVVYYVDSDKKHSLDYNFKTYKLPYRSATQTNILFRLGVLFKQIRELRKLKKQIKPDVSLSFCLVPCFLNVLSRKKDIIICSERTNPEADNKLFFYLTKLMYSLSDYIIFQSETVRSLFGKRIRAKSCILKNPLIIPEKAADIRAKKIVNLGRLDEQKNQKLLIRSFADFHKKYPDYTLHIYGEGRLEAELNALIDSLKLSDCIFLEGNHENVHQLIRDAEMFVLSSDYEGLSNALLECMSMGIACISTGCEGSVDVIRNGENGLLAEKGDVKALTQAMCTLAADKNLRKRIEKQAMEDMRSFEAEKIIREWEKVISDNIQQL